MTVRRPSGNIWGAKEHPSQASKTERQAGQPERGGGSGRRGRRGKARSELGQRLLGFIYLGGRRWGSLAVGGLRAEASSFGDGGARGWVLGGRRGADYDRGGHGEVGAVCGEGLLAPLLKRAARTGSEGRPTDPQPPHPETPASPRLRAGGGWEPGRRALRGWVQRPGWPGAPGSRYQGGRNPSSVLSGPANLPAPPRPQPPAPSVCLSVHVLTTLPVILAPSSRRMDGQSVGQ